ncbi:ABC transporter ATP-binding protein [Sanyastnella coralliicola]|uniref:ABC transporter ATP-binding protein n=1 Tax=Sanyastnella coralliicola TaxID=3069118 RepID=UPI0027BA0205|nr:ATP-binding cassette domain-containing protein [Longitalea sp. SCSIO 12813]
MMVLETKQLTKHYGKIKAANEISLQIPEGSVFGILGPNGSGKSTTLGMVLGATQPTSGEFTWFGQGNDHKIRRQIGAILERPIFYPSFTATQNLKITARIKEVDNNRINEVLKLVGLYERRDSNFKTYSLGMKQRLAIASAMLCDPKVLILDEPTNGLDPQGIAEIRQLILEIAESGKTIVLASHLLDEVQKVCSDFCVLRSGRLIYQGKVEDTGETASVEVEVKSPQKELELALNELAMVKELHKEFDGGFKVVLNDDANAHALNAALFDKGITVDHLVTHRQTLEEKFLEILKNEA